MVDVKETRISPCKTWAMRTPGGIFTAVKRPMNPIIEITAKIE
jgi:hypothetical protein